MAGGGAVLQLDKAETIPKPTEGEDAEVGNRGRHLSPFGAPGTSSTIPPTAEQPKVGGVPNAPSELDILVARINKQELVQDVAHAVSQQVEAHTMEVVGEVWNQGKIAMQKWQRDQAACVETMQDQLKRCTDSFVELQRENAALRTRLEAMVRHIQMYQWSSQWGVNPCQNPAAMVSCQNPAGMVFGLDQYKPEEVQKVHQPYKHNRYLKQTHSDPGPLLRPSKLSPTPEEGPGDIEDESICSETPYASPQEAPQHVIEESVDWEALPPSVVSAALVPLLDPEEILQDAPAPATPPRVPIAPSAHTLDEVAGASEEVEGSAEKKRIATTPSTAATTSAETPPVAKSPTSPIGLTLRRAQGQPLGLKVRELGDQNCLFVESVQPGSVADSWNQQCAGENREIKPGDRLVSVNGSTLPVDMRNQCMQKLLLKLELVRDAPIDTVGSETD